MFSYPPRSSASRKIIRCASFERWSITRSWGRLSPTFNKIYSHIGRPSIPPEHLLRALLLQILYTVRSERLLMEQLEYNMLFRWFVGLNMD